MSKRKYPVPTRLNLFIYFSVCSALLALLYLSGQVSIGWGLAGICAAYALIMTTGYSLIHEAEHNLLHPSKRINDALGIGMSVFFPAPFHLLRQGHLGHHLRNRSDDEAFDYYFEGDSKLWKYLVLYGTMIGMFWVTVLISNLLAAVYPKFFKQKFSFSDRPAQAFSDAFNPRYLDSIRAEGVVNILFHGLVIWLFDIPWLHWILVLATFGFLWSAMQYVHHYGTERHVQKGAKNLKTLRVIDSLWMNHNWHLNHHMKPTVPWIYLPELFQDEVQEKREGLLKAYAKMWRGPMLTDTRVENRFRGKVIK